MDVLEYSNSFMLPGDYPLKIREYCKIQDRKYYRHRKQGSGRRLIWNLPVYAGWDNLAVL